jgi:hypothetical protein
LIYQEIQYHARYALDSRSHFSNNKTFLIPVSDRYLLAVLNSPMMWWHNWRYLPHMKDEALSPVAFMMEQLPIAKPRARSHERIASAVDRLLAIHCALHETRSSLIDWYRHAHEVDKPSVKLREPFVLDADQFVAEVKKALGRKTDLSAAAIKAIKAEHARTVVPTQVVLAEAERLERQISDLVNEAYGLTPDDVRLMWDTAPPRMPISPPSRE